MSKDLEKEYKALMEDEVSKIDADALWNRIETALPEKEEKVININTGKKWYKSMKTVTYIGTIAAACLLVVLVMPGLLRHDKNFEATNRPSTTDKSDAATVMPWDSSFDKADAIESVEAEASEDIIANEAATNAEEPSNNKAPDNMTPDNAENSSFAEFVVIDYLDGYYRCETEYLGEPLDTGIEIYIEAPEDTYVSGERYSADLVSKEDENGKIIYEIKK